MINTALYVCYHVLKLQLPLGPVFHPLYVGKDHQFSGDHIHDRNALFGELSALYWIWKNDPKHSIIGLCHYRRFFVEPLPTGFYAKQVEQRIHHHTVQLKEEIIHQIKGDADWILPEAVVLTSSVQEEYVKYHGSQDLHLMRKILEDKSPSYISSFDAFFGGNKQYLYNMFITSREILDDYCQWLFPLLFEFEKQDIQLARSEYQKRVLGFLGERLLNVYIFHNQFKIKSLPVVLVGEKNEYSHLVLYRLKGFIKNCVFSIKKKVNLIQ